VALEKLHQDKSQWQQKILTIGDQMSETRGPMEMT
jgi:hypothetical protein